MRKLFFAAAALAPFATPAFCQSNNVCFDIVDPRAPSAFMAPIRINKCTGETWLLARNIIEKKPNGELVHSFSWSPIPITNDPAVTAQSPIEGSRIR
jgi:hypothetical protein